MSATETSTVVPFVGLRPFETADADWFFGRDRETETLTRKLRGSRFTAVVGPSGSGKSSVVRAGVVPLLHNDGWQQIITTPGSAPLDRLARALAGAEAVDRLAEARRFRFDSILRASAFGLAEIAETLRADAPRLLLVVDQFEELFRYGDEAAGVLRAAMREEARAFVELLLTATRNATGRLQICATMRSDYFGACSAYVGLAEAISASQYLIPLPQRGQLEEAIRKPVVKADAQIEEALVQRLLVDVAEETDQLPLLQHTLRRLWEQASGEPRTMREADYVAVGKIAGSIDKKAEAVVAELEKANSIDVRTLACVMKALTDLDERGRATRRLQKRSELLALVSEQLATAPAGAAVASLDRVLAALQAEGTSFLRIGDGNDTDVDIGHEALIRGWTRLSGPRRDFGSGWLREERDDGDRWRDYVRRAEEGAILGPRTLRALSGKLGGGTFGKIWSERYGGRWENVKDLEQRSKRRTLVYVAVSVALSVIFAWAIATRYDSQQRAYDSQRRAIEQAIVAKEQTISATKNFELAVTSAQKILNNLSTLVDRGEITIKGANDMLKTASNIVAQVNDIQNTKETIALLIKFAHTTSDLYAALGNYTQAYESAQEAKKLVEQLLEVHPADPELLQLLYASIWRIGDAIPYQGNGQAGQRQALEQYLNAEKLAQQLPDTAFKDSVRLRDLVFIHQKIGDAHLELGDADMAIAEYRSALMMVENVAAAAPDDRGSKQNEANIRRRIGQALTDKSDFTGALNEFRAALNIRSDLVGNDRENVTLQSNLATDYRYMAALYAQYDMLDAALAEYRNAIAIQERLITEDPTNATWQFSLAFLNAGLGDVLRRQGDLAAALDRYRTAYQLRQGLALKDPTNPGRQNSLALAAISVADALEAQKQNPDEAVTLYRKAIAILDEVRPRYDNNVVHCYIAIGDILRPNDRVAALKEYQAAAAIARDRAEASDTSASSRMWRGNLENSYMKIGDLLSPPSEVIKHYQQSLEFVESLAMKYPTSKEWPDLAETIKAKIQSLPP